MALGAVERGDQLGGPELVVGEPLGAEMRDRHVDRGRRRTPVAASTGADLIAVRALADHPLAMSKRSRRRNRDPRQPPAAPAPRSASLAPAATPPEPLLLDQIAAGELDHSLDALADAIGARVHLLHTVKHANALAQLCVGDEVRINNTVKPRYLHGVRGRITDIQGHDVTVCMHHPVGRFTSGEVRCSALALERLSPAPTTRVA